MKVKSHILALAVCASFAGPAIAEPTPGKGAPTTMKPGTKPAPATASFIGCMVKQWYNTQGIDSYSMQFTLANASGEASFNFAPAAVEVISPSGFALATRAATEKWSIIIRSLETAAAAKRTIMVEYTPATNNVFGITINWNTGCP